MNEMDVCGLFDTENALQRTLQELIRRGYAAHPYSIIGAENPVGCTSNGIAHMALLTLLEALGLDKRQTSVSAEGLQRGEIMLVIHRVEAHRLAEVQDVLEQYGVCLFDAAHSQSTRVSILAVL